MSNGKGLLIVYAGASGVGKGTVLKKVLEADKNIRLSVSATTRKPRDGEQNGREYYFISEPEFEKLKENEGLLEYATYCNNNYGTPKKPVYDMLEKGLDVVLEIEINGFLQIKDKYPECITIFVLPPSWEVLENRLKGRGTESEEEIKARLDRAKEEMEFANKFNYKILNDDADRAANEILSIINNIKNNNK